MCLFMTFLRTEINLDNISTFGYIVSAHYHISLPCGFPQSVSLCIFFGVIISTNSFNDGHFFVTGLKIIPLFSSDMLTLLPDFNAYFCVVLRGRRNAKLFPHFLIVISIVIFIMRIYKVYTFTVALSIRKRQ